MPPLSHLLIPTDFSEQSRQLIPLARLLACQYHSRVTMLNVVQDYLRDYVGLPMDPPPATGLSSDCVERHKLVLDWFAGEELAPLHPTLTVVSGRPAEEIVREATARAVDLIVMPTHGRGPVGRLLLGSVTAQVLADAPCPVLTSAHAPPAGAANSPAIRRIICAVDLGPHSCAVVQYAAQLARDFRARLALLHVLPVFVVGLQPLRGEGLDRELRELAREKLQKLQAELPVDAQILIEAGPVTEWVRWLAESTRADLLVIGRGGEPGSRERLHSDAYTILRHAPCPVISV